MEEFDIDIDIVDCLGRWHGNVDGLTRAYERVGDVLEDDDFSKYNNDHQCKKNAWGIPRNHSILGWHEVSSWSHKGGANMNCAQKSKLFDNRLPT